MMTSAIKPTPARPCSTYIHPHVTSAKRYGLRVKKIVRTRNIMKTPVAITESPAAMIAPWNPLFSNGYFANRRGAGTAWPKHRRRRLVADVCLVRPDRPEVEPERRVDDVKQYRRRQHRARDPVKRHPVELHTD